MFRSNDIDRKLHFLKNNKRKVLTAAIVAPPCVVSQAHDHTRMALHLPPVQRAMTLGIRKFLTDNVKQRL